MSTLCDSQLIELCMTRELVTPFDEALINPASIDLRVGHQVRFESMDSWKPDGELWEEAEEIPASGFTLRRNQTVLLDTLEYVRIPIHCMAEMWLKSSTGRNGLDTYKAGYIDPGFHGTLTFRITNQTSRPFLLRPGMRLVQMVVREMSKVPAKPYTMTGRYNGQRGPTEAR